MNQRVRDESNLNKSTPATVQTSLLEEAKADYDLEQTKPFGARIKARMSQSFGRLSSKKQKKQATSLDSAPIPAKAVVKDLATIKARFYELLKTTGQSLSTSSAIQGLKYKVDTCQNKDEMTLLYERFSKIIHQHHMKEEARLRQQLESIENEVQSQRVFLKQLLAQLQVDQKITQEKSHLLRRCHQTMRDLHPQFNADLLKSLAQLAHLSQKQLDKNQYLVDKTRLIEENMGKAEDNLAKIQRDMVDKRFALYLDPLTQMPNRQSYQSRLNQEYERWRRYRSYLSLAVIDLDFFKRINDEYGLVVGDIVLQSMGHLLKDHLRASDFLARYGGEEFVVLMPETTKEDALRAMEKLRYKIEKHVFRIGEYITLSDQKKSVSQDIRVTISVGVSGFDGVMVANDVESEALAALIEAKDAGRNQVVARQDGSWFRVDNLKKATA